MDFALNRPQGFEGAGDKYLPDIVARLIEKLIEIQDEVWWYEYLYLSDEWLHRLAIILVEFAEDLHNDTGLWRSLETYQQELFGTPLPLLLPPSKRGRGRKLMDRRVRFLLSVLYPFMQWEIFVGPDDDEGLPEMSEPITDFLIEAFAKVPKGSGIKQYLSQPIRHTWDVQDRLTWLGQSSYLFRLMFAKKVARNDKGEIEPGAANDFLYTATTPWSGLGAIDILAATLDLTAGQRTDVRSWYERHLACYLVETVTKGELLLKNLFNEAYYRVEIKETDPMIEAGTMVRGSLVPWDGVWYWTDEPEIYHDPTRDDFEEIKTALIVEQPELIYLYDPEQLKRDRAVVEAHYDAFVDCFYTDFHYFSDGEHLVKEMIEYRARVGQPIEYDKILYGLMSIAQKGGASVQSMPKGLRDMMSPWLKKPSTGGKNYGRVDERLDLLPYLAYSTKHEDSIAFYFNPEEGLEILKNHHEVQMALMSTGILHTDEEGEAIRHVIEAEDLSPGFIEGLLEEEVPWSIAAAYRIQAQKDPLMLPFVLRQYKGQFYRKRYPNLKSL